MRVSASEAHAPAGRGRGQVVDGRWWHIPLFPLSLNVSDVHSSNAMSQAIGKVHSDSEMSALSV